MSTSVHADKTRGDDNAIIILEFENGVIALAEESWTKLGGMDDRAEVHGSEGVAYADLLHGNAIETYSAQRLRLRGREGGHHRGLELHDVRGGLELRLPAGDGSTSSTASGSDRTAARDRRETAGPCSRSSSPPTSRRAPDRKVLLPFARSRPSPYDLWKKG